MKDYSSNDPTLHKGVIEMVTVANEFCLFIEQSEGFEKDDLFDFIQKISPLLYLKGSLLPLIDQSDETVSGCFVNEEQWEGIFKTLRNKFGDDDLYITTNENQELEEASLSENLADVYQDLKDFILFFNENTFIARRNAITQLKRLFDSRWGSSLLNALLVVHGLLGSRNNESDDNLWNL
jgi:hypothetical protein